MADNVIRLASVNDSVVTDGDAARELVAAFLREWADAVANGEEDVTKVVLVMYNDAGEQFRVRTRRCNMDLVQQVGVMQIALTDLCVGTAKD